MTDIDITRQELRTAVAVGLRNSKDLSNKERERLYDVAQETEYVAFGDDMVDEIKCVALQANVLWTNFPNIYDAWLGERHGVIAGVLHVID